MDAIDEELTDVWNEKRMSSLPLVLTELLNEESYCAPRAVRKTDPLKSKNKSPPSRNSKPKLENPEPR